MPAYRLPEAAHYLHIPRATLRSWVVGRAYPTSSGSRLFRPVIALPDPHQTVLSFVNLVEAHVLEAIRRQHGISLEKIRVAIEYLRKNFAPSHPLADHRFETDGLNLFVEKFGQLINITKSGQLAMREVLQQYLRRIEHDQNGFAVRLYPFTRTDLAQAPKLVVIDPGVAFGRPVLKGTGIPTATIAERYKAGESVEQLTGDYSRSRLEIEEAIRCELQLDAA